MINIKEYKLDSEKRNLDCVSYNGITRQIKGNTFPAAYIESNGSHLKISDGIIHIGDTVKQQIADMSLNDLLILINTVGNFKAYIASTKITDLPAIMLKNFNSSIVHTTKLTSSPFDLNLLSSELVKNSISPSFETKSIISLTNELGDVKYEVHNNKLYFNADRVDIVYRHTIDKFIIYASEEVVLSIDKLDIDNNLGMRGHMMANVIKMDIFQ